MRIKKTAVVVALVGVIGALGATTAVAGRVDRRRTVGP